MIRGIEHFAVASFDPHRLATWYMERLECRLILDTGQTVYVRSENGAIIEFVFAERQPPSPQMRDAGLRHIAFLVDDLDATCEELEQRGISFADLTRVFVGITAPLLSRSRGQLLAHRAA